MLRKMFDAVTTVQDNNMQQMIHKYIFDINFCKVIKMIQQNIFNRANFSFRS